MKDEKYQINVKIDKQKNAKLMRCNIGDIIQISLKDYLFGVVAAQMGNMPIQACKAQAVAARTTAYPYYSTGKTINDSTPQCFNAQRMTDKYKVCKQAVDDTDGMLICFNGTPCQPCSYSANNGGKTVSSRQRWGTQKPWLIEKEDCYDSPPQKGTGVGMSQIGAKNRANAGEDYKAILAFYYDKTTVETIEQEVMQMQVSVDKFLEQANYIRDHFNSKTKYQNGMSGQLVDGYYRTDCRSWACSLDTPQMRIFFQLHRHKLYEPQTNRGVYIS